VTRTKIVANIAYTLRDREADRGLVAICEGGGTADAMLIERV
jgi:acetyl-CoA acetyltransferase